MHNAFVLGLALEHIYKANSVERLKTTERCSTKDATTVLYAGEFQLFGPIPKGKLRAKCRQVTKYTKATCSAAIITYLGCSNSHRPNSGTRFGTSITFLHARTR